MQDRSPCIGCGHRYPGCQSRCEIGKRYWARIQEQNEKIKAAKEKEDPYKNYKSDRIFAAGKAITR